MARDEGLEALVHEDLAGLPGLGTKAMFGGLVWLLDGHLLCGARRDGMLARLGAGRDAWALALPGIVPMRAGQRPMRGWIWADATAYGDDDLRRRLLDAALGFVRTLAVRPAPPGPVPWDFPEPAATVQARPARRRLPRD